MEITQKSIKHNQDMKNIHVLPTDKPSTICKIDNVLVLSKIGTLTNGTKSLILQHIYITSDEEIKEDDWFITEKNTICKCVKVDEKYAYSIEAGSMIKKNCKKIILTTDQDLIKDGVQAIDDEFLEFIVKNPNCEEVEIVKTAPIRPFASLYKIIIPKEEAKKKHIVMLIGDKVNEEQTKCYCGHTTYCDCGPEEPKQETLLGKTISKKDGDKDSFEDVTNYKIERSYSEEDMLKSFMAGIKFEEDTLESFMTGIKRESNNEQNFEQFIKQINYENKK